MSDREDLEKQAVALGVEFAPNIGDKKLAARVKAAQQEAAGVSDDAAVSDDAGADENPEADQTADASEQDGGESGFTVLCAVAEGRRRAGRRWPGGVTHVSAEEMTDGMLAELLADPLLQVTPPAEE